MINCFFLFACISAHSPPPPFGKGSDQLMEMTRLAIWKMCNQHNSSSSNSSSNGPAKPSAAPTITDLHRSVGLGSLKRLFPPIN